MRHRHVHHAGPVGASVPLLDPPGRFRLALLQALLLEIAGLVTTLDCRAAPAGVPFVRRLDVESAGARVGRRATRVE